MDLNNLIDLLKPVVLEAGYEIMKVYRNGAKAEYKDDGSPVTIADKLSEDEIIKGEGSNYQTASEIEKEIAELTEDGSPYWQKTHPNHAKTVDRVFKLRAQLNG